MFTGPVLVESPEGDARDLFLLLTARPAAHPHPTLAKADAPGERWITLHPHGKGGEKSEHGGVHVKIHVGADGSGHVISGPGELRGLRLTRLASAEELEKRRKERDAQRTEKRRTEQAEKERKAQEDLHAAASDPEAAQRIAQEKLAEQQAEHDKKAKLAALEQKMVDTRGKLLQHAHALTGDDAYDSDRAQAAIDPTAYEAYKSGKKGEALMAYHQALSESGETDVEGDGERAAQGAGAVIASRNVRQIKQGLDGLRKHLVRNLLQDDDLRSAVLGEDDAVDPAALESGRPSGSPGYRRMAATQALQQGFTPARAKGEAGEVFKDRLTRIALQNPKRAEAIAKMRQMTMDRAAAEREVKTDTPGAETLNTAAPVRAVAPAAIKEKAEQVREFLKTHDELKAIEREMRRVQLGHDPQASDEEKEALDALDRPMQPGAELNMGISGVDDAFAARLDAELKDAEKQDLTRAFLDSVDADPAHSGFASDVIRKAMHMHVGVGAHAHLSNVALSAIGHEGVDRQVVDTLGVEAAAQLIAYAIGRDKPDELGTIKAGLGEYHDETSLTRMKEAMEQANAARADAAEIELPPVTGVTDAALALQLQREKKARISEAHEALGTALGQVEAGAALNAALGGRSLSKGVVVRFGNANTATVATSLRALGLTDGEYEMVRSEGRDATLFARINPAGMDRLTAPLDEARQQQADTMRAIKNGEQDEGKYLPAGFVERPASSFNENPAVPPAFAEPLDLSGGVSAGVDRMIASRYADGWDPSEIYAHLRDDVAPDLTPDGQGELFEHVRGVLPITREVQKVARDGSTYTAHEAQDIDRMDDVRQNLSTLTRGYLAKHHPGMTDHDFHNQHLPDNEQTREAVFRTLAANPALAAAFAPPADLGGSSRGRKLVKAIRAYAEKHILSEPPTAEVGEDAQRELARLDERYADDTGKLPDKWAPDNSGGLFGGGAQEGPTVLKLHSQVHATAERLGEGYSPELRAADQREQVATQVRALEKYGLQNHRDYTLSEDGTHATLTDEGRAHLRVPSRPPTYGDTAGAPDVVQGGLEGLNPRWVEYQRARASVLELHGEAHSADGGAHSWPEFVELMGGPRKAYQAVQERMQSDFFHDFHEHHGQVTGRQLRVSKTRTASGEKLLASMNPERAAALRRDRARMVARVRSRTGGKFAGEGEGSAAERADRAQADAAAAKLQQGSLFGAAAFGGGQVQTSEPRHLEVREDERYALGQAAESRLAQLVNSTPLGVGPTDSPVGLIKNLDWGAPGRHGGKQRGVKALLQTGRLLGFYGAGSGKTAMQIGGFTQAHKEGKARKALLVCPSIVRNQFGEEAAKFTTPGEYSWHAHDDTFEGRKKAYQGDTHMIVVTHATFRDDMVKLMAEHASVPAGTFAAQFEGMDRATRAATLKAALEHHGIPLDYLAIDEAHDFLNRAGKQDSLMSAVAEAAMDNSRYKSLWTGSPVKNDPSEIHDWLAKVDPERFSDRDAFMRRYGVNTLASQESLKRLMDDYAYVDSTTPDIQRHVTWGARDEAGEAAPLKLTPKQQEAYQGVLSAFQRASKARRDGQVDVDACRTLSPRSFEGVPEEQHQGIAAGLMSALGTLKHSALGKVVNEFPAEHNAKVQHVLQLAGARKGRGGVVFARNRESVSMLREQLTQAGFRVGIIDGSTTTEDKGKVRNSFDRGEVDIVIASDAGATGANLQKRGEWLVNYDLPLTYKTMEQRNARIDRLGQSRAIELHHLQTDTPYDTDNMKRLRYKRELGSILQGEFRSLDDQGLSGYLLRAKAERRGEPMESWEEPLGAPMNENAAPQEGGPDVPDSLPDAPVSPPAQGATVRA